MDSETFLLSIQLEFENWSYIDWSDHEHKWMNWPDCIDVRCLDGRAIITANEFTDRIGDISIGDYQAAVGGWRKNNMVAGNREEVPPHLIHLCHEKTQYSWAGLSKRWEQWKKAFPEKCFE